MQLCLAGKQQALLHCLHRVQQQVQHCALCVLAPLAVCWAVQAVRQRQQTIVCSCCSVWLLLQPARDSSG
jgi:hypothetical protein